MLHCATRTRMCADLALTSCTIVGHGRRHVNTARRLYCMLYDKSLVVLSAHTAYVKIPCNDVTVRTFLAGTSGLCNSDISSDRKSSETRMAEQRPREVSRSGLVAVSDPQPMLLLPRRSALGHLHEGDACCATLRYLVTDRRRQFRLVNLPRPIYKSKYVFHSTIHCRQ